MNTITRYFVLLTASVAVSYSAHANWQHLQTWDFTTADSGLAPTQVQGTVPGGLSFTGDGSGQLTNGSALRISRDGLDANSWVDLRNHPNFDDFHTWRVEYVFGGWNFDEDAVNRRLSLAFVSGDGSFLFAANASIRYFAADPDPLTLRGEAFGTGGAGGTPASTNGTPITGWTPVRTDPVSLRVDHTHDPVNDVFLYSVFYDNGDGFVPLFENEATSSDRTKFYVRIGAFDDGWGDSFIDINSMSLYAIPEPSTYALIAGLGIAGLLLIRRRRCS